MSLAVISLTLLGIILGGLLGIASQWLAVEEDPIEKEIQAMLPGSQCGQCGFVGCAQAAAALAKGEAPVTLCPPGGKAVAEALAKKLGVQADLDGHTEQVPQVARINEAECIGCMRCFNTCTVDAIIGAPKQLHAVLTDICHGCGKCLTSCQMDAITLNPVLQTTSTWYWPKPEPKVISKEVAA
ncbi:MAG: electron transporter RnfB [Candidatus Dactylopiibacterium carminicum]|uniref:Ion-translocating oxidoreductase complex subunit B n=1 Tax=Candidatus Dactylopiibacterium carminicum TaxID=857335 RepID=A0A272EQW6_9RHOO|nr:RnfABCDGE type electron transport complex subunit B [Candidatus Dactylopiibacterium carminicum]KAF7598686.1 electron transporter RnfB [Candidatus Dactylopiibacterium carminicum]PAS92503.1 MAG: electron transporter RnfB [Candidatus Dactylopiibacterium carminicum]PAS98553.1 MAG: electron transporter RnfB [Candidatus Dactylopiibacterium carminicum]